MSLTYLFTLINIWSFQYYNLTFFFLFPFWCLCFLPQGGEKGHQETWAHLHWHVGGNWETLQKEHMIKTHVLASHMCLESIPNPTPLPLTQLSCAQVFAHVGEYIWTVRALALNTNAAPYEETTRVLHLF
jgi:hypothetical protein